MVVYPAPLIPEVALSMIPQGFGEVHVLRRRTVCVARSGTAKRSARWPACRSGWRCAGTAVRASAPSLTPRDSGRALPALTAERGAGVRRPGEPPRPGGRVAFRPCR